MKPIVILETNLRAFLEACRYQERTGAKLISTAIIQRESGIGFGATYEHLTNERVQGARSCRNRIAL